MLTNLQSFVKLIQNENETNLDTLLRLMPIESHLTPENQTSPSQQQLETNTTTAKPDVSKSDIPREGQSIELKLNSDRSINLEHESRRNKDSVLNEPRKPDVKIEIFDSNFIKVDSSFDNPVKPSGNIGEDSEIETNSIAEEIFKSKEDRSLFIQNREKTEKVLKTPTILDSKPEMPKVEADLKQIDTKPDVTLTPNNNSISGVQIETLIKLDLIPEVMEPEMSAAAKSASLKLDNRIWRSKEDDDSADNKTSI